MTTNGFEIVAREDISLEKHIEFVCGVLAHKDHETWGLEPALEAISFALPIQFEWHPDNFVEKFAKFLVKIDVIKFPTREEVFALSSRIIAVTGRNFTLIDLIRAWEIVMHTWELNLIKFGDTD